MIETLLAAAMIQAADSPLSKRPIPDPGWDIENLLGEHERLYERLLTIRQAKGDE